MGEGSLFGTSLSSSVSANPGLLGPEVGEGSLLGEVGSEVLGGGVGGVVGASVSSSVGSPVGEDVDATGAYRGQTIKEMLMRSKFLQYNMDTAYFIVPLWLAWGL